MKNRKESFSKPSFLLLFENNIFFKKIKRAQKTIKKTFTKVTQKSSLYINMTFVTFFDTPFSKHSLFICIPWLWHFDPLFYTKAFTFSGTKEVMNYD